MIRGSYMRLTRGSERQRNTENQQADVNNGGIKTIHWTEGLRGRIHRNPGRPNPLSNTSARRVVVFPDSNSAHARLFHSVGRGPRNRMDTSRFHPADTVDRARPKNTAAHSIVPVPGDRYLEFATRPLQGVPPPPRAGVPSAAPRHVPQSRFTIRRSNAPFA